MRFEDDSFRVVVLASMNMMSNAVNAWWSIVFYGAIYAPYFTVCAFSALLLNFLDVTNEIQREVCGL